MSEEQAFLSAICAQPEEDTPRLAYADWLDENEAPIQAAFIRTQCRLASCSAADPEYPDLVEQHTELLVQFGPMLKQTVPELPEGFAYDEGVGNPDTFRRGFLDTVYGVWEGYPAGPSDEDIDRICAGLAQLIATTTARKLQLAYVTGEQIARVLAAPGAEQLTGLSVWPADGSAAGGDELLRVLAGSGAGARLVDLRVHTRASAAGLNALAGARFPRLAYFDPPILEGGGALTPLTGAKWFRGLRSTRALRASGGPERELVSAYAKLPHLETLTVPYHSAGARSALGTSRGFPELARLVLSSPSSGTTAARMARARFPRLAELEIPSTTNAGTLPLLRANWFPQLRCLSLGSRLTDKFALALAKSGAAPYLRILRLWAKPFGPYGLAALTDGTRFPELTTLDLEGGTLTAAQLARFARDLSLPHIRHLDLRGWPLCDTGARALAANPVLANLTRLGVRNCRITEKGLTALMRSPHLQQLIELDVRDNKLKAAVAARDTDLLPRLSALRLEDNPLAAGAHRKLQKARGLAV
jgi:uncharacterized protein (TIGR02996 family)